MFVFSGIGEKYTLTDVQDTNAKDTRDLRFINRNALILKR